MTELEIMQPQHSIGNGAVCPGRTPPYTWALGGGGGRTRRPGAHKKAEPITGAALRVLHSYRMRKRQGPERVVAPSTFLLNVFT